jgi:hypothetical protein
MRKRLLSFLITGGLLTLAVGAPVWPQTFPAPGPNVPHAHVSGGPALDENASTLCSSLCPGTPESVSVSFTSTAGTHIIVWGSWCDRSDCGVGVNGTDISSVSDGSNAFVQKKIVASGVDVGLYLYEATYSTGGTHTITLTFSSGIATIYYATLLVSSWTNLASGDALDQFGSGSGTGTNGGCTTGGNLGQSNELVLGYMSNGGQAASAGSGFTAVNNPTTGIVDENRIGGASGSTVSTPFVSASAKWSTECSTWLP